MIVLLSTTICVLVIAILLLIYLSYKEKNSSPKYRVVKSTDLETGKSCYYIQVKYSDEWYYYKDLLSNRVKVYYDEDLVKRKVDRMKKRYIKTKNRENNIKTETIYEV